MPSIDECLRAAENEPILAALGAEYVKMLVRRAQADLRDELRAQRGADRERAALLAEIIRRAAHAAARDEPHLRPVVNATGVVLHTNLGRAILPEAAIEAIDAGGALGGQSRIRSRRRRTRRSRRDGRGANFARSPAPRLPPS